MAPKKNTNKTPKAPKNTKTTSKVKKNKSPTPVSQTRSRARQAGAEALVALDLWGPTRARRGASAANAEAQNPPQAPVNNKKRKASGEAPKDAKPSNPKVGKISNGKTPSSTHLRPPTSSPRLPRPPAGQVATSKTPKATQLQLTQPDVQNAPQIVLNESTKRKADTEIPIYTHTPPQTKGLKVQIWVNLNSSSSSPLPPASPPKRNPSSPPSAPPLVPIVPVVKVSENVSDTQQVVNNAVTSTPDQNPENSSNGNVSTPSCPEIPTITGSSHRSATLNHSPSHIHSTPPNVDGNTTTSENSSATTIANKINDSNNSSSNGSGIGPVSVDSDIFMSPEKTPSPPSSPPSGDGGTNSDPLNLDLVPFPAHSNGFLARLIPLFEIADNNAGLKQMLDE
ncbi:hypothetical protein QBC36DRAFT_310473 [Triangularia setosa]|uniref:Uncharacterized protein n=1 Tax=Triangularia setosa TaxID=2587417 RepID=A0AAN6W8S7_9PEZI|nr:hypothetical protein QBC36DRAFT_310473 [Podospora setosa]